VNAQGGTDEMKASGRREIAKREISLAIRGESEEEQHKRRLADHAAIIDEHQHAGHLVAKFMLEHGGSGQ
jgi:hypothetical protein